MGYFFYFWVGFEKLNLFLLVKKEIEVLEHNSSVKHKTSEFLPRIVHTFLNILCVLKYCFM